MFKVKLVEVMSHHLFVRLLIKAVSKHGNNKQVDKKADGQGNSGLDCVIEVGLTDAFLFLPVNFPALKECVSYAGHKVTLTRAE